MSDVTPTVQQRIARGLAAWERDDYAAALAAFDEVLEAHPDFPDVHNKVGLCMAMLGRLQEALTAFERAVDLAPTYAEAHLNRGIVLNELGRHTEAQRAFDESTRLDIRDGAEFPSHVGNQIAIAHARLGDLYLVADRPRLATREYAAALEIRPRFLDIRTKFAEALLETGALEEALRELETVLEGNEDFTGARLRIGVVLHRLGRTDEAVEEWRRCLREDPGDMRPRAYLASAGVRDLPAPG
jgi:tetratricopeptide (TPR) repeat protein